MMCSCGGGVDFGWVGGIRTRGPRSFLDGKGEVEWEGLKRRMGRC